MFKIMCNWYNGLYKGGMRNAGNFIILRNTNYNVV